MDNKIKSILVDNVLTAVFNRPEHEIGGELDQICERACDLMCTTSGITDALIAHRDQFKKLLTQIGDAAGDKRAKAAVYLCWKMAYDRLDEACQALERGE